MLVQERSSVVAGRSSDRRLKRRGKGPFHAFRWLTPAPLRSPFAPRCRCSSRGSCSDPGTCSRGLEEARGADHCRRDAVTPHLTAHHRLLVTPARQPCPGLLPLSNFRLKKWRLGCRAADLAPLHMLLKRRPVGNTVEASRPKSRPGGSCSQATDATFLSLSAASRTNLTFTTVTRPRAALCCAGVAAADVHIRPAECSFHPICRPRFR